MPSLPRDGRLIIVPSLILLASALSILVRAGFVKGLTLEVFGHLNGDWPKLLTAPFVHRSLPYAFIVLVAFAIFGSTIERKHGAGWIMVLGTWLLAGAGGAWLSAEMTNGPASGALAPAVAITFAYGMVALDSRRGGEDTDLAGVGVALVVLLLLPPLVIAATWQEAAAGLIVGMGLGSLLTVLGRRN